MLLAVQCLILLTVNSEKKQQRQSPEVHKLWVVFPGGGASCLYEGHIYFERNIGER
jgi:hypothetical protein